MNVSIISFYVFNLHWRVCFSKGEKTWYEHHIKIKGDQIKIFGNHIQIYGNHIRNTFYIIFLYFYMNVIYFHVKFFGGAGGTWRCLLICVYMYTTGCIYRGWKKLSHTSGGLRPPHPLHRAQGQGQGPHGIFSANAYRWLYWCNLKYGLADMHLYGLADMFHMEGVLKISGVISITPQPGGGSGRWGGALPGQGAFSVKGPLIDVPFSH